MGWRDIFVMNNALDGATLERGPAKIVVPGLERATAATVSAQELNALLAAGQAAVADLASSLRYPEGHIPGAWQVVRSRLRENLAAIPGNGLLVFTAPDERLARLAAMDAAPLTARPVKVLAGGTGAWSAAGYAMEKGPTHFTGPTDDVRYRAMDHTANVEAEIHKYPELGSRSRQCNGERPRFRISPLRLRSTHAGDARLRHACRSIRPRRRRPLRFRTHIS